MWVGTSDEGISIWSPAPATWTQITEKQKLPHHDTRALVCDYSGDIWAATSGGGAVRFFERDSGYLSGVKCRALAEDQLGRLWVGTEGKGIAIFDSSGMQTLTKAQGLPATGSRKSCPTLRAICGWRRLPTGLRGSVFQSLIYFPSNGSERTKA